MAVDVDVIIIGAGLAGLIAARDLRETGLTVRVLEGRARVGGRTLSVSAPDGSTEDLGAEFVQLRVHHRMIRELSRHGIPLEASDGEGAAQATVKDARYDALLAALDRDAERVPHDALWHDDIADLDIPFRDLLRSHEPDERVTACVEEPVFSFTGVPASEISALYVLREARGFGGFASMFVEEEARVVGGTQALSVALSIELGGALRTLARVTRVEDDGSCVRVTYLDENDGREYTDIGRGAVVAVPFNVLHRIAYEPTLPDAVRAECERGHSGRTRKTYFNTDSVRREGEYRVLFEGRSPARTCIMTLPEDDGGVIVDDSTRSHDWAEDEFARGTWVSPRPGQLSALDFLRKREGRVVFAGGDIALSWPGWLEGAVASGEEVVTRLTLG